MSEPIIGREKETAILESKLLSQSAEFIAVYGRRRVGKTYLIKQFFSKHADISFEQTGLNNGTLQEQLAIFTQSLSNTFYKGARMALPKNWMDALQELTLAIDNTHKNERIVLFFDELPWLAARKSGFLKALEYFWNTRWAYRKKLILVVCGSAASWMLENLIYSKGGLHNRITARIPLQPFNLRETKEYLRYLGVNLNHQQILQLYMAMGGIPHYLKEVSKGLSAAQNINEICFQEDGLLFDEFDMLFHSLYEEPETYLSIIRAIAKKPKGISRKELIKVTKIAEGGRLTTKLRSLEEAGFIGGFLPLSKAKRGVYYRIIDEYILFYLTWIKPFREVTKRAIISDAHYWELAIKKPAWQTWTGQTFEAVCFKHANKIRRKLNIEHIAVICGDWQYHPEKSSKESGAQIDLVFDREDWCTMLCEIKYSDKPYTVTKEFVEQLKKKETVYREKTKSKKQIFWVLIAANGASENQHLKDTIHHVITLEDLFWVMYNNLRDFISALEEKKDLIRIKKEVSTVLEMTEIHRRVLSNKGSAIIFENVVTESGKNSIPVLVNLFGTIDRIALGLGINPDELRDLGKLLAFLQSPELPKNFKDAMKMFPLLKVVLSMRSKVVSKAPCQEVVLTGDEVDLSLLPIQTCWQNEPAPLITWPIVVTKGPTENKQDNFNLGIYRMQVVDKKTTLMRWLAHRGGASHHKRWKEKGQSMKFPAAAVIGSDPATLIAAVTPVPETLSEYQFAGLLRKKPLELVNCKTIPLQVPAHAEIVLEGYVSFDRYQDEGPYGDHTGYYNSVEQFPEFNITVITMRKNPIYLSTFTGKPPDEPSILGEALNEIFVPILINQFPEIVDFYLPPEGCSYRIAVVSIKKSYPGHAKRVVMGILSFLKQFLYTKFIIVVDDDINVRDWKEVMWAISTRMDPMRDTIMIENAPIDYLDFASPESGLGSKMGFDATNKIPPETKREWGKKIEMSEEIVKKVTEKWEEYGL